MDHPVLWANWGTTDPGAMDCDGALSSRGTAGDWVDWQSALAAKLGQQIQTQFEVVVAASAKCPTI